MPNVSSKKNFVKKKFGLPASNVHSRNTDFAPILTTKRGGKALAVGKTYYSNGAGDQRLSYYLNPEKRSN